MIYTLVSIKEFPFIVKVRVYLMYVSIGVIIVAVYL